LAPYEPKRLKTKEPSTKQKSKDGKGSKKKNREEEKSEVSATSARWRLPRQPVAAETVSGKQGPQLQGEADQPEERNKREEERSLSSGSYQVAQPCRQVSDSGQRHERTDNRRD
jgi:hypothetical protein